MKYINKKSIALKISVIMFAVIVLQSVSLIGSVLASGVVTSLRDNAYESFVEKVDNRKDYMQDEMVSRWSNIESYAYKISAVYDEMTEVSGKLSKEDITPFLKQASPTVLTMLRSTMTTGGFLILNDRQSTTDVYSAVYFRDYDPVLNNDANKDLYMIKGPVEVSRALQIPLEATWNYGLSLSEEQRALFDKPYEAAGKSKNLEQLGYWHIAPDIGKNGSDMITYSVPLIDGEGEAFGVMGVEISQEYLYKILPSTELSEGFPLGYALASYNVISGEITPILLQGTLQKEVVKKNKPLTLEMKNEEYRVYSVENINTGFPVLMHFEQLKIYNNNAPFEDEQWILMGLVDEKSILGFSESFIQTLYASFLFSLIMGVAVAFLVGMNFSKPIMALAKKVQKNDPQTVLSLGKTGLSEIDELAGAIESLNHNVLDVFLKTDKIIHMVNLQLGTFEYKKDSEFVTCSPILFDMLEFPKDLPSGNMVDSGLFFERLYFIQQNVENLETKIYRLQDNPPKWVRIVTADNYNCILGVIMDVTGEVLDNHAIKLERDYDSLTKIYNRFAFKRETNKIFENGVQNCAAFILFDLDNLKYINDTYGHDMGDIYIQSAAAVISQYLATHTIVGRMSGDEFYVFMHNFASKDEIRQQLKIMYEAFEDHLLVLPNGNEFKMRMSGGIAWYGDDSNNLDELISFADFAMYEGKHTVKGEIREFDKQAYVNESFMLSGREELNKVLDNQLVEFAFQPIVSTVTGEIYAYESLMRPQSEVLSSPSKLIQIAKAQSQLWRIEKITFFKTLSAYVKHENLFNGCKIFINSVPNEILKDAEYREIERLYPQVLKNIVIEIIENEKLDTSTLKVKQRLVESWGGALALDDYGTGYNGDISLLSLSPQIVKIDALMTKGIETDPNRQSIIQKLILYARGQNILVLAEGVETKGQMEYLIGMGVDLLQGYYIGYPTFVPGYDHEKISAEILAVYNSNLKL